MLLGKPFEVIRKLQRLALHRQIHEEQVEDEGGKEYAQREDHPMA
jgi:hypothetical protein